MQNTSTARARVVASDLPAYYRVLVGFMSSSGSWQPRALKKRGAEFVVAEKKTGSAAGSSTALVVPAGLGAATSSSSTTPTAVSTAASSSKFGGAADLEDLEDEAVPAKRARPEGAEVEAAAGAASAEVAAVGPPRDEIIDGAPRLAAHITSASKFNKVAAMAFALLEAGRVTHENAPAFFTVLQAGLLEPRRMRDKLYRVAYRKLYAAAISRASLFPASAQPELKRWQLLVLTQIDLHTDDSFQFNKAAKHVRERLEELPCIYPALEPAGVTHLPPSERRAWADVLFECLDAAMCHHKHAWARPTCDTLIKAAIDRRQNWDEEQQSELQLWNATCKGQRIQRQQEHLNNRGKTGSEPTAFERAEEQWRNSDIATAKRGESSVGGGGLDGWCAKQALN